MYGSTNFRCTYFAKTTYDFILSDVVCSINYKECKAFSRPLYAMGFLIETFIFVALVKVKVFPRYNVSRFMFLSDFKTITITIWHKNADVVIALLLRDISVEKLN